MLSKIELQEKFRRGELSLVSDYDNTLVTDGEPDWFTRKLVAVFDPLIITARWGPDSVKHIFGPRIRVVGAQGAEFHLDPDQPAEIWKDAAAISQELLHDLERVRCEHPEVSIRGLMTDNETIVLYVKWNLAKDKQAAHAAVKSLIDRHAESADYIHRHTLNDGCDDLEIIPQAVHKQAAFCYVLDVKRMFTGQHLLVAGDAETDMGMLDEAKRRGFTTAFVGPKLYEADFHFASPNLFRAFLADIAGFSLVQSMGYRLGLKPEHVLSPFSG